MRRTSALVLGASASLFLSAPAATAGPVDLLTGPSAKAAPNTVSAVAPEASSPALRLSLNREAGQVGDRLSRLHNSGHAPVDALVVTSDGGEAVRAAGGTGTWALRLPAYSADSTPPRAVLRVEGAGASDALSPGSGDFRFGASFSVDEVSSGSDADDGDNLVQRGLYGDGVQFKLQLDGRVPTCSVHGDAGVVTVSAERVQAERWYRARCYRAGDEVTIRVWEHAPDGLDALDSATVRGAIGSVDFTAQIPLSVGGKLDASGDLVRSSGDQFNGLVDNVVFDTSS